MNFTNKENARTLAKQRRNKLPLTARHNAQNLIIEKLKSIPEIKSSQIIASYNHIGSEVDLSEFNHFLYTDDKIVVLPCIIEKSRGISYRRWSPHLNMIKDACGVLSPANPDLPSEQIDVFLIPMCGFDRNLFRLGMGLGCYDKFFAQKETNTAAIKIGVAFSLQEIEMLTFNDWDIKMDMIVTEKEIIC